MREVPGSNPGRAHNLFANPFHDKRQSDTSLTFEKHLEGCANESLLKEGWSHGVMVSTLDSESSDPSSNLGGTYGYFVMIGEGYLRDFF